MKKVTINWVKLFRSFLCLIGLVFLVTYTVTFISGGVSASSDKVEYITVIASKGDTLWSIASENTKGDIRKKVDEIVKFNNKRNTRVELNERIKVPVER